MSTTNRERWRPRVARFMTSEHHAADGHVLATYVLPAFYVDGRPERLDTRISQIRTRLTAFKCRDMSGLSRKQRRPVERAVVASAAEDIDLLLDGVQSLRELLALDAEMSA